MTVEPIVDSPRRFGPYVLLHAAGAGGMGRVDLAIHGRAGMAKLCVLKRIHADLRSPEQEARFRREATVALRLSHGAIAQTFSVDEIEGDLCILQELIEGVSLVHLLNACRSAAATVPVQLAIHITREVARALAYAHALEGGGVIHRDVTPDNVMLSYSGEVKLIDFGIAKSLGEAGLTQVGMIVGRRSHTAPEVLAGEPADTRADVYSLGIVLWQALTAQVLNESAPRRPGSFPPPSSYNPAVPAALDGIVARMIEPDPGQRYQRADEVQEELGHLLDPGFVGDRELARLLGRYYDIDRERGILADEVARAQRRLAEEESQDSKGIPEPFEKRVPRRASPPSPPPESSISTPLETGPGRRISAGAAIGLGAVLVLGLAFFIGRAISEPAGGRAAQRTTGAPIGTPSTGVAGPAVTPTPAGAPGPDAPPPAAGESTSKLADSGGTPKLADSGGDRPTGAAGRSERPVSGRAGDLAAGHEKQRPRGGAAPRAGAAPPPAEMVPALPPLPPSAPSAAKGPSASDLLARAERSFDLGQLGEAVTHARAAARAGAGGRAHLVAGKALLADGKLEEAEAELEAAVRATPDDRDARQFLERIRARRRRE